MPEMVNLGERCSAAERRADEAVWDVEEQLKVAYMQQHVGQRFEVIVASVAPFGLFVRVPELHVDGLVHVSALPADYYHRDPSGTLLTGERTGREYRLLDRLEVELSKVDVDQRKIDFRPIESADSGADGPGRGTQPTARKKRSGDERKPPAKSKKTGRRKARKPRG
jgi:ribonuclease R